MFFWHMLTTRVHMTTYTRTKSKTQANDKKISQIAALKTSQAVNTKYILRVKEPKSKRNP